MEITFVIPGEPFGKQRPKVNTFTRMAYTPDKTVAYESWVRMCYLQDFAQWKFAENSPLFVHIDAYYTIPKSATKKRLQAIENGDDRPMKKPDWDNIGKAVCDALNSITYKDDSQIVHAVVDKWWTLDNPRVIVKISDEGAV